MIPKSRNGKREQVVDIYLNFIGKFEIPLTGEEQQEEAPIQTSKKKLRQEMTKEQVQRERGRKRGQRRKAKDIDL